MVPKCVRLGRSAIARLEELALSVGGVGGNAGLDTYP